jgi:hypothetical protein
MLSTLFHHLRALISSEIGEKCGRTYVDGIAASTLLFQTKRNTRVIVYATAIYEPLAWIKSWRYTPTALSNGKHKLKSSIQLYSHHEDNCAITDEYLEQWGKARHGFSPCKISPK